MDHFHRAGGGVGVESLDCAQSSSQSELITSEMLHNKHENELEEVIKRQFVIGEMDTVFERTFPLSESFLDHYSKHSLIHG